MGNKSARKSIISKESKNEVFSKIETAKRRVIDIRVKTIWAKKINLKMLIN